MAAGPAFVREENAYTILATTMSDGDDDDANEDNNGVDVAGGVDGDNNIGDNNISCLAVRGLERVSHP